MKINKDYSEKLEQLKKYNENYYNKSKPLVDDATYDYLKTKFFNEKIFIFKSKAVPSITVGYKPSKYFKGQTYHPCYP